MKKMTVRVESFDAGLDRFKRAFESAEYQGEFVTFESMRDMMSALTSSRWELIRALQAEGPMSLRALARRLGRDVKNVHRDVAALKDLGLIDDHRDGGIWVPYDEIAAELSLRRDAA